MANVIKSITSDLDNDPQANDGTEEEHGDELAIRLEEQVLQDRDVWDKIQVRSVHGEFLKFTLDFV